MKHNLRFTSPILKAGLALKVGLVLGLGTTIVLARSANTVPRTIPFEELTLTIEINATDADSGIVFFSDTDESLEQLMVQDPGGLTVFHLTASDPLGLGITELFWESAEPDIQTALLAYPEGQYMVTAVAFDGTLVAGAVDLSHTILARPTFTSPDDGDQLALDDVRVKWKFDPNADGYWLEIESEDLDLNYTIPMPPGVNKFKIPPSLLEPGTEYKLGLGVVHPNGNVVVSEVEFETL